MVFTVSVRGRWDKHFPNTVSTTTNTDDCGIIGQITNRRVYNIQSSTNFIVKVT